MGLDERREAGLEAARRAGYETAFKLGEAGQLLRQVVGAVEASLCLREWRVSPEQFSLTFHCNRERNHKGRCGGAADGIADAVWAAKSWLEAEDAELVAKRLETATPSLPAA